MAESGRQDYDRLISFTQLEPGEPFFFMRGRDPCAPATVRAWAAIAYKAGVPGAMVESALQQAERLEAWPSKKLPDADHITAVEAQQLEYQLQRRAWNHRIAHAPNEAALMAEQRGAAAAIARERHADALLVDLVEALAPIIARTTAAAPDVERCRAALQRVQEDLALRLGRERGPAPTTSPDPAARGGELVGFPGVPAGHEAAVSIVEVDRA